MNPGQTISHYRIAGQLGRGGMGVVYQAKDTKLDRTVAIKVLPPAALVTEDDRARFYREAKSAAQLTHPNIAGVYEIDEAVPSDAPHGMQPSPFIAMEYVSGGTLAEQLEQGPLRLNRAVRIAKEVASALGAAHAKDIVHRDIKASNVMLDGDGRAKVLDFGLAKTTHSTMLTQLGSTLGTAAYMSPEQARGEDVDHRSDLWSLGVLMYEMIAGRLPFRGDYEQAVVYGIMNEDPEPLTALRSDVPMELERIVGKLLSRDPRHRYQSAADLVADLDAIEVNQSSIRTSVRSRPGVPAVQSGKYRRWIPYAVGAATLAVGLLLGSLVRSEEPETEYPMHVTVNVAGELNLSHPAISPTRRYISFTVSGNALLLYDMTDGSIRRIVEESDIRISRFSPDGRWLAFEQDASGLSIVRIPDGSPARLTDVGETPTWIDNEWVMYRNEGRVERISRVTQEAETLWSPPDSSLSVEHPEVLPGGSHALVSVVKNGERSVGVLELESGMIESLHPNGIAARYVSSGHIIFTEQDSRTTSYRGDIYAQPFDLKTMSTRGPAILVLSERGYWELGMNERGDLVTTGGVTNSFAPPPMALSRLNPRTGDLSPLHSPVSTSGGLGVSDDGEWLLYMLPERIPAIGLLDQGRMSPLPQVIRPAFAPLFGHNGETVFYSAGTPGTGTRIYRQPADGSRRPEHIELGLDTFEILCDVVDKDRLGLVSAFPIGSDLGALEIVDLEELVSIRSIPGLRVSSAHVSPDGEWIVFDNLWAPQADRGVYAVGMNGSGPWLLGAQYSRPLWALSGSEVYVVASDRLLALPVSTTRGVRVSGPERLLYNASPFFDFTLDPATGDIIIVDRIGGSETLDQIDLVLNWDERLKELVPRQ